MHLDQVDYLPDDVLVKTDRAEHARLAGDPHRLPAPRPRRVRRLGRLLAAPGRGGKALLHAMLPPGMNTAPTGRYRKTAFRAPAAEWLRGPLAPRWSARSSGMRSTRRASSTRRRRRPPRREHRLRRARSQRRALADCSRSGCGSTASSGSMPPKPRLLRDYARLPSRPRGNPGALPPARGRNGRVSRPASSPATHRGRPSSTPPAMSRCGGSRADRRLGGARNIALNAVALRRGARAFARS